MAVKPVSIPSSQRRFRRRRGRSELAVRELLDGATFEVIPMTSFAGAVGHLRAHSRVSVTCSPAQSIDATLDRCGELRELGHRPVPHVSARMVTDHDHLVAIRRRLHELHIREIFVVGGDADPPGCFFDAPEFLSAFLALDDADGARQVDHIGITAYPDSHPAIPADRLHSALHHKQDMILATGRTAHAATQMCFDPDRVRRWLSDERAAGLRIPVHLGVPGVVDRAKLLTMGVRLGVGTSLRYLSKNRRALGRMMTQRAYEPTQLLDPLADDLAALGVDGLHVFTFNQVEATEAWRASILD